LLIKYNHTHILKDFFEKFNIFEPYCKIFITQDEIYFISINHNQSLYGAFAINKKNCEIYNIQKNYVVNCSTKEIASIFISSNDECNFTLNIKGNIFTFAVNNKKICNTIFETNAQIMNENGNYAVELIKNCNLYGKIDNSVMKNICTEMKKFADDDYFDVLLCDSKIIFKIKNKSEGVYKKIIDIHRENTEINLEKKYLLSQFIKLNDKFVSNCNDINVYAKSNKIILSYEKYDIEFFVIISDIVIK
jgi:hypothetical protein